MESDDARTGAVPEHDYRPASASKNLDPTDQLYFNDMDIRAWERRTAALGGAPYSPEHDFQEDEGYCEDTGEALSPAEYEEMLFQRVLDKIRLARAAGVPDVQLSQEEIEAYQSKLHGTRPPAMRSSGKSRSGNTPNLNDAASLASLNTTGKPSSSRSKKSQQRGSLFAPKPKKEKTPGRKRAVPNLPSVPNPAPPPGFVVPGPDGRPMYTPITAYQGDMVHDAPRTPPFNTHELPAPSRSDSPREMPGAFPGAFPSYPRAYQPTASPRPDYKTPEPSPRMMPFPVEPYQYHAFSQSSSSQSSPQPQYTRKVSSESSHTAMPRRVPVPGQRPAPATSSRVSNSDPALGTRPPHSRAELDGETFGPDVLLMDVAPQFDSSDAKVQTGKSSPRTGSASGGRRDEEKERKRKSGRSKKKH